VIEEALGFFYDDSNNLQFCPEGCASCSAANSCDLCLNGYFLFQHEAGIACVQWFFFYF